MTPGVHGGCIRRLERRWLRKSKRRRAAATDAALDALTDDQLQRGILLGRRYLNEGPASLTAAELAELEAIFGPILAIDGSGDESGDAIADALGDAPADAPA